jgi:hypothetical protein
MRVRWSEVCGYLMNWQCCRQTPFEENGKEAGSVGKPACSSRIENTGQVGGYGEEDDDE